MQHEMQHGDDTISASGPLRFRGLFFLVDFLSLVTDSVVFRLKTAKPLELFYNLGTTRRKGEMMDDKGRAAYQKSKIFQTLSGLPVSSAVHRTGPR